MSEDRNNGAAAPDDDDGVGLDDEPQLELGDEPELDDGEERDEEAPEEEIRERPEPPPRRQHPGRRERAAAREIRELRERVERAEREALQARQYQQTPRVDPAEQQRREQQWREQVSLLPPDQAAAAWAERTRSDVREALLSQQVSFSDQIDRTSWDAACRTDPVRARFAQQVEQAIAAMPPSAVRNRETVFTYLYGQAALQQRNQRSAGQRQTAQRRVAAQTTQPSSSRSDGVRQRGQRNDANSGSIDERWARLRNSGRPLGNW